MVNINNELPTLEEVYAMRTDKQVAMGKKLSDWISLSNNNIMKLACLYPMLDAHLFYDYLSPNDIKRFADELSRMSQDMESFSVENMNFFKIGADFLQRYSATPKVVIDNEEDLKFDALVDEFLAFNYDVLKSFEEGVTRKV